LNISSLKHKYGFFPLNPYFLSPPLSAGGAGYYLAPFFDLLLVSSITSPFLGVNFFLASTLGVFFS